LHLQDVELGSVLVDAGGSRQIHVKLIPILEEQSDRVSTFDCGATVLDSLDYFFCHVVSSLFLGLGNR
jgi:hypothetical protein